jgi:hypothetical protein
VYLNANDMKKKTKVKKILNELNRRWSGRLPYNSDEVVEEFAQRIDRLYRPKKQVQITREYTLEGVQRLLIKAGYMDLDDELLLIDTQGNGWVRIIYNTRNW